MRRNRLFKRGVCLGAVLASLVCRAQTPIVGAPLDTVRENGFYRVILPPDLIARCKADFSDLRLYRFNHGFVPYVLKEGMADPLYLPVPDPQIKQRDSSNKHSYISLQYADTYRIDKLSFIISHPALYKRKVRISNPDDSSGTPLEAITDIDPRDTVFRIPPVKAKRLLIDISNADNEPLIIDRVSSFQVPVYILTILEKGKEYELEAGDWSAVKPDYDLHYFTDSFKMPPYSIAAKTIYYKKAAVGPARSLDDAAAKIKDSASGNTRSGILLWSVIVLVLLLLIYISVKMVKAIAKKEIDDRL
ncbi:MAG: hypothetical protein JST68_17975 [Bacteroidetes bacterium]|nr:hypothetical protein [Bacteroidota bacterium]